MEEKPLYPFGFGLSYTQFEYESIKLEPSENGNITAMVHVKNTGKRDAQEVVQLYLGWNGVAFRTPLQALKAFERVTIAAGQSAEVRIPITPAMRRVVDPEGKSVDAAANIEVIAAGACPIERSIQLGAAHFVSTRLAGNAGS